MYSTLVSNITINPTAQGKWNQFLNFIEVDWQNIYTKFHLKQQSTPNYNGYNIANTTL